MKITNCFHQLGLGYALVIAVALPGLPASGQAPPNDNFTNRFWLTGLEATARGTNNFATREAGEPAHAGLQAAASLWWTWQAPYDGVVQFGVTNSGNPQTRWAFYTGTVLTNLSAIASNRATTNRVVEFPAVSNSVYQIAIDKLSYSSTIFTLRLALKTLLLAQPPSETRVPAGTPVTLRVLTTEPDHPLTRVDYYASSNFVASSTADPFDGTWVPTAPGRFSIMARATNSLAELRDTPLVWINVVPANDAYSNAAPIPGNALHFDLAGENFFATAEAGEPAHAGRTARKSLWWAWTPQYSGLVTFAITSAVSSPSLAIYTGDALTNLMLVAANTNNSVPFQAQFNGEAGTTYWIAVDGTFSGLNGAVQVQMDLTTLRFVNAPWLHAIASQIVNLAVTN